MDRRLWILAGLVGIAVIVVWTCYPILANPQLRPDDYRYLHIVELWRHGEIGLIDASVVENRWDHLWWIDVDGAIRFFRPTVFLSYWFDSVVHGSDAGFLTTNIALHLLCSLLVFALLWRWFGAGIPTLVATWLFAAMFCHGEVLWYVAGRTDSLAALCFLGGLCLYSWAGDGRSGRLMRIGCVAAFALGLLTKELVVGLPLVCLLADRHLLGRSESLRECLARERWVYASFVATAVVVVGAGRWAVSSAGGGAFPEPYFIMPGAPEFPGHIWTIARNYSENLLLATPTPAFLGADALARFSSWWGLCLTAGIAAAVIALNRNNRAFWTLAVLALVTWAPTSIAYVSERYLYLPSAAVVAVVALSLTRLTGTGARVAWVVVVIWCFHQAHQLREKNAALMTGSKEAKAMVDAVRDLELGGKRLLLVNLPMTWVGAQFSEDLLRVIQGDRALEVTVLTVMPLRGGMGRHTEIRRDGDVLVLTGQAFPGQPRRRHVVMERSGDPFAWVNMSSNSPHVVEREGMTVQGSRGDQSAAAKLEYRFTDPIEDAVILKWEPPDDESLTRSQRARNASIRLIPVSSL